MQNQSNITRFGLVRHAQTIWNREKKIQGQKDTPLTSNGKTQALRWGQALKQFSWDRILASDIGRAWETAKIINQALSLSLQTDSRLREQDWGEWEGLRRAEIELSHTHVLEEQVKRGWEFRPPNGESRKEVLERVRSALAEVGSRYGGEQILVICHQGVIKALVYELENRKFRPEEPKLIDKNSLQLLSWNDDGFSAKTYNITPAPT